MKRKTKKWLVDMDGVLCEKTTHDNYENAIPRQHVIDSLNALHEAGDEIVIYTSRRSTDFAVTEQWINEHDVPYDGIITDKPLGDHYIDDRAVNFLPYIRPSEQSNDLVICLSGGLDSTTAYHIANKSGEWDKITCLFFNIGQPYYAKEKAVLDELQIPYKEIDLHWYAEVPMQGHIIPNRNAIFANIACAYGDTVWIVGLKYEDHYLMFDKNDSFYNLTSLALSQSMGKRIKVETPFSQWSKTDILKYLIRNDLRDLIDITTSCYHETKKRCGKCSLCVRRWVAGQSVGLTEDFESNPKESEEAKQLKQAYEQALKNNDYSHYSRERIDESLKYL